MDLSREVVKYTGRLPLTLEVLGSFLRGLEYKEWESELKKLKKVPPGEVQKKLMVSYDGLDDTEKEMFLDIACDFVGENKGRMVDLWKACSFYPEIGLNVLIRKFLVKIDKNNILRMHDQLREMGRRIVNEESPKEPGKRSRLWNYEEIKEVLKEHKGTEKVEVVKFEAWRSKDRISFEDFATMSTIRILEIVDTFKNINGNIEDLPSKLKCLKIDGGYATDLLDNTSGEAGNGGLQKENFENLEVLDLYNFRYPSKSLEFVGQMKKLVHLNIKKCFDFNKLPDSIGRLSKLEELYIKFCPITKIPDSIGEMESLVKLNLSYICIKDIPDSIARLFKLKELSFRGCGLLKIPDSIGRMKSLVDLNLSFTLIKEIPNTVGRLEKLQKSDVTFCKHLKILPELPSSLKVLNTKKCYSLKRVPDLSNLKMLELLRLCSPGILDNFGKLESLVQLNLRGSWMKVSEIPDALGQLKKLEYLSVYDFPYLESIPSLPSSLIDLSVKACKSLKGLPDLSKLKNLQRLTLYYCMKLAKIQGLEAAESLNYLSVRRCGKTRMLVQDSCNNQPFPFCESQQRLVISDNEINDRKSLCLAFKLDEELKEEWLRSKSSTEDPEEEYDEFQERLRDEYQVRLRNEEEEEEEEEERLVTDMERFLNDYEEKAERLRNDKRHLFIKARIHRNDKLITCESGCHVNGTKKISRENICIQTFQGLDWYGIPLKRDDEIEIIPRIYRDVLFWGLEDHVEAKCSISLVDSSSIDDGRWQSLPEHVEASAKMIDFFSMSNIGEGESHRFPIEEEEEKEDGLCLDLCLDIGYGRSDSLIEEEVWPNKRHRPLWSSPES